MQATRDQLERLMAAHERAAGTHRRASDLHARAAAQAFQTGAPRRGAREHELAAAQAASALLEDERAEGVRTALRSLLAAEAGSA